MIYRKGSPGEPDEMPLANVHYPTYYETFKEMWALYHDKIELKLGLEFGMPPMSFAVLIFIFEIQNTKSTLAYLVYCMSAYSLIIWISALPKMIKRMKSDIRNSKIMQKRLFLKLWDII